MTLLSHEPTNQVRKETTTTMNYTAAIQFLCLSYTSRLDFEKVYVRAIKQDAPTETRIFNHIDLIDWDELDALNSTGYNIYYAPHGQGFTKEAVKYCYVVTCECDTLTLDQQLEAVRISGLPEPSAIIYTGNKSYHFYWFLQYPCDPSVWSRLQMDIAVWLGFDTSLAKPSQPMRLPGFKHPKTGKRGEVYSLSGKQYTYEELRSVVPVICPETKQDTAIEHVSARDIDELVDELEAHGKLGNKKPTPEVQRTLKQLAETSENRNNTLHSKMVRLAHLTVEQKLDPYAVYELACETVSDWDNQHKTLDTLFRGYRDGFKVALVSTAPDQTVVADTELTASDLQDGRYLKPEHFDHDAQCVVMKSPKGTGKTNSMKPWASSPDVPVLAITHRRTLAWNLANKLNLSYYEDDIHSDKLSICVDSLWKVDLTRFDGGLIILDEATQLIWHLLSSSTEVKKRRRSIYGMFSQMLKRSSKVFLLDADMNQLTVDWVRDTLKLSTHVVVNTYQPKPYRTAHLHKTETELWEQLVDTLQTRQHVIPYVVCTTATKVEKLRDDLRKVFGDDFPMLLVYGDTTGTTEVDAFIADPQGQMGRYRVIIVNQAVGTGVDINTTYQCEVFGFMESWKQDDGFLIGTDWGQMLARVRKTEGLYLWVSVLNYDRWTGFSEGLWESEKAVTLDTHYEAELHNRLAHLDHSKTVLLDKLETEDGYTVVHIENQEHDNMTYLPHITRTTRDEVLEARVRLIMDAPDITITQREEFDRRDNKNQTLTVHERAAKRKYLVRELLGSVTERDVRFWLDKGYDKLMLFMYCFLGTDEMATFSDLWDEFRQKPEHDRHQWVQHRELFRDALLGRVLDDVLNPVQFEEATLDLSEVRHKHRELLYKLFDGHVPSSDKALVAGLLKRVGLELDDKRVGKKKKHIYFVTDESIQYMKQHAGLTRYNWKRVLDIGAMARMKQPTEFSPLQQLAFTLREFYYTHGLARSYK